MRQIRTFLWFDNLAEEAVQFYTSVFENSKINSIARYGDAGPGETGTVMTIDFEINGSPFVALNGGPVFTFNPSISFVIDCDTQEEVDYYWEKLGEGGQYSQCGWLEDRYGVSWQVVPLVLYELVNGPDEASQRVMQAMLKMIKLEIEPLKRAHRGD